MVPSQHCKINTKRVSSLRIRIFRQDFHHPSRICLQHANAFTPPFLNNLRSAYLSRTSQEAYFSLSQLLSRCSINQFFTHSCSRFLYAYVEGRKQCICPCNATRKPLQYTWSSKKINTTACVTFSESKSKESTFSPTSFSIYKRLGDSKGSNDIKEKTQTHIDNQHTQLHSMQYLHTKTHQISDSIQTQSEMTTKSDSNPNLRVSISVYPFTCLSHFYR